MGTGLINLANETREQFELHQIPRELLGQLYTEYNPHLLDTREFLEAAEYLFPRLNCGLATVYLAFAYDGPSEFIQGAFEGESHTFLRVGKTVVDITADQYQGGPRIFAGEPTNSWEI